MSERFFSAQPLQNNMRVEIDDAEAHHMLHVLRSQVGDRVTLFDGNGGEFAAEITELKRQRVICDVIEHVPISRELPFEITLIVALPKGDRQQWLVEKATELGVTELVPLRSERSVAVPKGNVQQKMAKWVIAASKQCGRNRLMQIGSSLDFAQLWPAEHPTLVAHPYNARRLREVCPIGTNESIRVVIGPEGGFADREIEIATDANAPRISLGPSILRVETAAITIVSQLLYAWS